MEKHLYILACLDEATSDRICLCEFFPTRHIGTFPLCEDNNTAGSHAAR